MILFGLIWTVIASRLPDREVIRVYGVTEKKKKSVEESHAERNKRRKLRKKLR
jgi:hypothetical protein